MVDQADAPKRRCGIVMPIGESDSYPAAHWLEVLEILQGSADRAGFSSSLVSEGEGVNIIQKSIVQNLYFDEIIICDVSGQNPNVMIELGMRLAFDKPVVIVKDDQTRYPFDTSNIQYIEYRKDLRHKSVQEFGDKLTARISSTFAKVGDKSYHSFIRTFGDFEIPDLTEKTVPAQAYMLDEMKRMSASIDRLMSNNSREAIRTEAAAALKSSDRAMLSYRLAVNLSKEEALTAFMRIKEDYPGTPMSLIVHGSFYQIAFDGASLGRGGREKFKQILDGYIAQLSD